jgi:putative ABC transport system permease protein
MSDENFFRVLPTRRRGLADLGLIRLKPGADPVAAQARLTALLPADVRVLIHDQYEDQELAYWTLTTPIGFIFKLGVAMGIVVGLIIVYQILYNDVNSHLPEYATLKAMGFPNSYMSAVVLRQALLLSIIGFLPGGALSVLIYKFAGDATLLPIHMTAGRMVGVYVLTALMCVGAGALAMRRVRLADPAEIF